MPVGGGGDAVDAIVVVVVVVLALNTVQVSAHFLPPSVPVQVTRTPSLVVCQLQYAKRVQYTIPEVK